MLPAPSQAPTLRSGQPLTPVTEGERLAVPAHPQGTEDLRSPADSTTGSPFAGGGSEGSSPLRLRYGLAADRGPRPRMEDACTAVIGAAGLCRQGGPAAAEAGEAAAPAAEAGSANTAGAAPGEERCQGFFAVFDGHGGAAAAHFAEQHILSLLTAHPGFPTDPTAALTHAFLQLDEQLYDACHSGSTSSGSPEESGTTALAALVWDSVITVANAGDSRAVLCKRGKAIALSTDHKPQAAPEAQRIRAAGGRICDEGMLNGHLGVSRALGDFHLADVKQAPTDQSNATSGALIAAPELVSHEIAADDEFLLLACDGLWDVLPSQRAVEFARQRLRDHNDAQQCAQDLVTEALRLHTADNVSTIVVCLRSEPPPRRVFGRSTSGQVRRSMSTHGLETLSTALSAALTAN